jgi:hypothetical protein
MDVALVGFICFGHRDGLSSELIHESCSPGVDNGKYLLTVRGFAVILKVLYAIKSNRKTMNRASAVFLQVVVVLTGIAALALLLWEPQTEGVNAHATQFEIYFKDPFLAVVYVGSIAFFVAVYQAFRLLGYAGQNKVFSAEAVKALRTIKYCAITIIGFVAAEEIFILFNNSDDRAGGVFMGVLITFGSIVIASAAGIFERILQNAVALKSGSDVAV